MHALKLLEYSVAGAGHDNPVRLIEMAQQATAFFSDTYQAARTRFLDAAETAGARLQAHPLSHATGPDGQPLFMDSAWLGPVDAPGVLVCLSATHGAEGYAGSAVQTAWLHGHRAGDLPTGVAILFVHGVNPYGFAWDLRGTENNIDLNRNWLDFGAALPDNALYERMHPVLCPADLTHGQFSAAARDIAALAETHGMWQTDDALSRGQYGRPDGLYFGGHEACWARRTLEKIARKTLSHATIIGVIDWHTGPVGDGELIFLCYDEPDSAAHARAKSWWGADNLDHAHVDRLWGSVRPSRHGLLYDGLAHLLGRTRVAGGVIEFCSAEPQDGPAGALTVSMLERWVRFEAGLDTPEAHELRARIRHNYAPERDSFRTRVLENAAGVYDRTLAGLARDIA